MSWSRRNQRLLFLFSFFAAFIIKDSQQGEHESRLYKDILQSYQLLSRPVSNESEPVVVTFSFALQQIVDVDELNQIIKLNVWLTYKWTDVAFQWESADYGGVKEIRLPPGKIWKPDVLLYNSADEGFDSTYPSNIVATSDGTMVWIPPGIVKSTCQIDITWFPFDDQVCALKFGSWTFSGTMLELRAGDLDNSTYTTSGEWDLISMTTSRNVIKYYFTNMIIPCLLISFMTLLDFTLPPESGEKLSLGVTIFMSLCVFLLMVTSALPPTSDAVALIGIYFSSVMTIVSVSVVFTVFVLNIHHRSPVTHVMGPWTKTIFLNFLPWLLRMERPGYLRRHAQLIRTSELFEKDVRALSGIIKKATSTSLLANILDTEHSTAKCISMTSSSQNGYTHSNVDVLSPMFPPAPSDDSFRRSVSPSAESEVANGVRIAIATHLEPVLHAIHKELKVITKKLHDEDEEEAVVNDWKFAAIVVDRLSFFTFTAIMIISTSAILFSAPHF